MSYVQANVYHPNNLVISNPPVQYVQAAPQMIVSPMVTNTMVMPIQTMPMVQTQVVTMAAPGAQRPFYRNCQNVFCQRCQTTFITRVKYEPGSHTWGLCLGLGVCLGPLASFVLCMDEFKDCSHFCSRCGEFLGKVEYTICNDD